jgi:hypothetical protein
MDIGPICVPPFKGIVTAARATIPGSSAAVNRLVNWANSRVVQGENAYKCLLEKREMLILIDIKL